jgi:phosphatidylglycerophosphate synthase
VFIEEYLKDLREQRFAPRAVATYAHRVGARVRVDLLASPSAVRSIWTLALAYFACAFLAAVGMSVAWDRELALRFFLGTALWMAPAFAFVTLAVGMLRDAEGYRLSALNVPLALTLLRVALLPGICLFLEERHFALALVTYLIAALSDVFDGWLARRWKQTTRLGTVMDPLVDIVFNLAMLSGLTVADLLPRWVFWLGVLRYATLVVGGCYLYLFVGPVTIRPTSFGRFTGVVMTVLISLFTLFHALHSGAVMGLTRLTEIALGVLLAATTVQIVLVGWYNLRVMSGAIRDQGHVVGDVRWKSR